MDLAVGYICRIGNHSRDPVVHAPHCAEGNTWSGRAQGGIRPTASSFCSLYIFCVRWELLDSHAEVPRFFRFGSPSVSLSTTWIVGTGTGRDLYQSAHSASLRDLTPRAIRPLLRAHLSRIHSSRSNPLSFHEYSSRLAKKHHIPPRTFRSRPGSVSCPGRCVDLYVTPIGVCSDPGLAGGWAHRRATAAALEKPLRPASRSIRLPHRHQLPNGATRRKPRTRRYSRPRQSR